MRAGGLFSETSLPTIDDDAITDPDVFFTLPKLISLLHEQIEIGNIEQISTRTGLGQEDLRRILKRITDKDNLSLLKIRLALGIS